MKKLIWVLLLSFSTISYAETSADKSNFGFLDLLYWQVREGGADNWAQVIPSGSTNAIKMYEAPFDWNTGFKIGMGHLFKQENFDLTAVYTHFTTQATSQAAGNVFSSYVGNYFADNTNGANFGPSYGYASNRWQFFYNTVDLNLGHDFKIDCVLQLHPFVGMKVAFINQNIYSNWLNPTKPTNFTSATENLKNNFWGVGPTIGVDTIWTIFNGNNQSFDLIGNVALGLLYGHWSFNDEYNNNSGVNISTKVGDVNGASPVVDGFFGVQWSKPFKQFNTTVRLGYETQVWFNQVQFYSLNMGRINRSTWLQGGNLEFCVNF